MGQWGQANYAAANSFLDAFSQYRHNQGLPAATIDIGAMEDIGYLSRNLHQLKHFEMASTHVLYEQDLLDTLQLMIHRSKSSPLGKKPKQKASAFEFVHKEQIALGLRSTQRLSATNNRTVWKLDLRMAGYYNLEDQDTSVATPKDDHLQAFIVEAASGLVSLDAHASVVFLATEIGKMLINLTMRDVESLDLESSPASIGVDSLVSIELRNWFRHKLRVDVTVLEIQACHSMLDLGKHVAGLLQGRFTNSTNQASGEGNQKYLDMKAP